MTDDLLVGDDDDKLKLATFSNQREKSLDLLSLMFRSVFFVLSTIGIGTPNLKPIQQQLSNEHLFWK